MFSKSLVSVTKAKESGDSLRLHLQRFHCRAYLARTKHRSEQECIEVTTCCLFSFEQDSHGMARLEEHVQHTEKQTTRTRASKGEIWELISGRSAHSVNETGLSVQLCKAGDGSPYTTMLQGQTEHCTAHHKLGGRPWTPERGAGAMPPCVAHASGMLAVVLGNVSSSREKNADITVRFADRTRTSASLGALLESHA